LTSVAIWGVLPVSWVATSLPFSRFFSGGLLCFHDGQGSGPPRGVCCRSGFVFGDLSFAESAGVLVGDGVASWVSAGLSSPLVERDHAVCAPCNFASCPTFADLLGLFFCSFHYRDRPFALGAFFVQQIVFFAGICPASRTAVRLFGVASGADCERGGVAFTAIDFVSTSFALGSTFFVPDAALGVDSFGLATLRTDGLGVWVAFAFLRGFCVGGPPAFPADLARGLFAVFAFVPGEPQGVASDAFLPWPLDAGANLVFVLGFCIVKISLADVAGVPV
jgi:hypothetical protein